MEPVQRGRGGEHRAHPATPGGARRNRAASRVRVPRPPQLLTEADLRYCTAYELYLARNEIFARHGYIFESADLREHFGSTSWYVPRYTADEFQWEWLSSVEMKNIALIQEREGYLAGASAGSGTSGVASGHVAADWISFELPESWIGYVDVVFSETNGAPSVTVSYRGNPDMVLVSFYRVDASTQINAVDIGSGLVSWWDDGRGHRIEMWGRNYVFQTQTLGTAAYPNAYVEAALIDLSTGGAYTVETARLSNQGNGSADGYDFYSGAIAPTFSSRSGEGVGVPFVGGMVQPTASIC